MPETPHCFLDRERPCNEGCVAYNATASDTGRCLVITGVQSAGKHLGVIASGMGRILNHFTDQARQNQVGPKGPA